MGEIGHHRTVHLQVDVTVEPHSLEWAVALASGASSRPRRGMVPANSMIRLL